MKKIVVDASVIVKWKFRDEEQTSEADIMLQELLESQIQIYAPTLWFYEVANALKNAVIRKRITEKESLAWLPYFQKLSLHEMPFKLLFKETMSIAHEYGISIYDASYVALAQKEKLPFYTGDRKLAIKLKKLPSVFWVGEYKSNRH